MSTGASLHTEITDGKRPLRSCLISHVISDR